MSNKMDLLKKEIGFFNKIGKKQNYMTSKWWKNITLLIAEILIEQEKGGPESE